MLTATAANLDHLVAAFEAAGAPTRAATQADHQRYTIDGLSPKLVVEPTTPDQVAAVLARCAEARVAVAPIGGATGLRLGNPPAAYDVALLTGRLGGILEYNAADLTVTVGAGLTLAELQAELAKNGQMLALDPPNASRATIGGVLATNTAGTLRLKYGSARDLLIGVRVAETSGVLTRAGGKVVKNVAGYDLNKLYIGSLGTLAIIVEATFKLHPIPEGRATIGASFPSVAAAHAAARELTRTPWAPSQLSMPTLGSGLRRDAAPGAVALLARVEGFAPARRHQATVIAQQLAAAGGELLDLPADGEADWWAMGDAPNGDPNAVAIKVALPPAELGAALDDMDHLANAANVNWAGAAQPGSGLIHARIDGSTGTIVECLTELRRRVVQRQGNLIIESAPVDIKRQIEVWGEVGPTLRLMQGIKRRFDPNNCLNPGRFVGGI